MRVLWICNIVIPSFADEFSIKKTVFGGWMESMLNLLEKKNVEISLAFPIYDPSRRHDGLFNNHRFYAFDGMIDDKSYCDSFQEEFVRIFNIECPDVVHIWGTEYNHTRAAVEAAIVLKIINRILIDTQGLCEKIAKHYATGIPATVLHEDYSAGKKILEEICEFREKGVNERISVGLVKNIVGRADWDRAICHQINPHINYFKQYRVLRSGFYNSIGNWDLNNCDRHSIFICDGSYPVKGLHIFLEAFEIIKETYSDAVCYISGRNPMKADGDNNISQYGNYIKRLIKEKNLENDIIFCQECSEMEMIGRYLRANVFVASSVIESNCNALTEAMLIGVPSVASFVGGMMEQIEHKKNGYLYQADAPYMLAYYISEIFDNDKLTIQFSKKGSLSACERCDRDKNIENLMKIYNTIQSKK